MADPVKTTLTPTAAPAADPAAAKQQAERTKKARDDSREKAADGVKERARQQAEQNAETERRMAAGRPTPSQEENDLAKVGALNIDEKEDDGSGPGLVPVTRMEQAGGDDDAGKYKTRDLSKK